MDWEKLRGKLVTTVENIVTLKVITVVGNVSVDIEMAAGAPKSTVTITEKNAKALCSTIDLAQGDIINVIPPAYADEAGQWIRDYHDAAARQGVSIIKDNLAAIGHLVDVLKNLP
jgi:hypothetical protein